MSWNYRVVRDRSETTDEMYYQIKEAYYDGENNIVALGDVPMPCGDSIEDLRVYLTQMLEALDDDVVDKKDDYGISRKELAQKLQLRFTAVHCNELWKAQYLVNFIINYIDSDENLYKDFLFDAYGEDTCINYDPMDGWLQCGREYYEDEGYSIIEFDDIIIR